MDITSLARAMTTVQRISDGADLLLRAGQCIGLPLVGALDDIASLTPRTDENGNRLAERLGWPQDFVDRWVEKAYTFTTPVFVRSRFEHLPFVWMIGDDVGEAGPRRRAGDELQNLGLTGGIAVPVRSAHGRLGGVHWWGTLTRAQVEETLRAHGPDLLVLASYFLALFPADASAIAPEDLARLSVREVECLTHAASGSADAEIAKRLSVSQHTVRFHIEKATAKLGARTRSHAIALAAQLGVIGRVN